MTAAGHPKIPVIPVIAVMPSGKTAPASTERMDNRYSAIRACLFLQDETGSDVAAGIPHGINLVPTWDEVADAMYCGAGLGENRPHVCGGAVFFEERGGREQPLILSFRMANMAGPLRWRE